jgi:hypothetical protein
MTDTNEQKVPLGEALVRGFAGMSEERAAVLRELAEVQTVNQALLQREERRLRLRFGSEHPRTVALAERLDRNRDVLRRLSVSAEIAKIRLPIVGAEAVLVYGRVTDERLHGIGGLLVSLTDEAGKPLRQFGRTETDASGAFSLTFGAGEGGVRAGKTETSVFLGVLSPRGQLFHRTLDPLQLEPGARILVEIRLNADDVAPPKLRRVERPPRAGGATVTKLPRGAA